MADYDPNIYDSPEYGYMQRYLIPQIPKMFALKRELAWDENLEWAIPRKDAEVSHLTYSDQTLYGIPIVIDDTVTEPTIRVYSSAERQVELLTEREFVAQMWRKYGHLS